MRPSVIRLPGAIDIQQLFEWFIVVDQGKTEVPQHTAGYKPGCSHSAFKAY